MTERLGRSRRSIRQMIQAERTMDAIAPNPSRVRVNWPWVRKLLARPNAMIRVGFDDMWGNHATIETNGRHLLDGPVTVDLSYGNPPLDPNEPMILFAWEYSAWRAAFRPMWDADQGLRESMLAWRFPCPIALTSAYVDSPMILRAYFEHGLIASQPQIATAESFVTVPGQIRWRP